MSEKYSYAHGNHIKYIETMYEQYKKSPEAVDKSWKDFFEGYEFALATSEDFKLSPKPLSKQETEAQAQTSKDNAKIESLINVFRRIGHLSAQTDPLNDNKQLYHEDLSPEKNGLQHVANDQVFHPSNFGSESISYENILKMLKKTYTSYIGADFRELNNVEMVLWLQKKMESCQNSPEISEDSKKRALEKLAQAEIFENFLQTKYLGQKRFSVEGLESLIPLLDTILNESANKDVEEVNIGMAHRGRLNVLTNILEKPYEEMLIEFEESDFNPFDIDGDVKYHMGYANTIKTKDNRKLRLYLSPNPSHLEAVNPVVEGFSKCRQQSHGGADKILPILLHGDAAFIGQGIVAETLNLSQLKNYSTGGTIHIITNNQIGFTTNPEDSKSCSYSSDIAKAIRAPVLHVNSDKPESVIWVAKICSDFRKKFKHDIVIDLVGYRRYGHNETDEPKFTQPKLYKKISQHPSVFKSYSSYLINSNIIQEHELESLSQKIKDKLQKAYTNVHGKKRKLSINKKIPKELQSIFDYEKVSRADLSMKIKTSCSHKDLVYVAKQLTSYPKDFTPNPKLKKLLKNRLLMVENKESQVIDWAFAELLAFGTLAKDGFSIRLSGQDCMRGTFSSRHGVFFDFNTGKDYEPFSQISPGSVNIINSPLSELACLGFEFGYSVASERSLVLWEAQFGDFVNGAQIIIDQFIVASEAKWNQTSNIVLLLPHGHEGMGPEHSSARPERFLQTCGNLNIQVCIPTTPSQYFHLLRRQMLRNFKKPLVVMTPKSLLRHPEVTSKVENLSKDTFMEVLDDPGVKDKKSVTNILLCSGKIYYELLERKSKKDVNTLNTALMRVEQLYPFPTVELNKVLKSYPNVTQFKWIQEEPQNMGAWNFVQPRLQKIISETCSLEYVGRKHSGTTAEGTGKAHKLEQQRIVEESFNFVCAWDPEKTN